ncbi:hypothetical protein Harman_23490 [Haloarcula mannanilytica]|uniref:Uncharacterized protein n=1 Tax=Haloarcula mannanilytica TaxID=2509225 RepID=A0A4C2EIU3_9EURY|nr:hypothetical protein [Haloarcula mannanilytica]GCF14414.1 hypothetical protein Harman_23490 [Haloarcula mannanilytica]
MSYRQTVRNTVQTGTSNFVGITLTSAVVSLTALPLVATIPLGLAAVVGGLWTSCLLLGVALVGLFQFAHTAADRGVGISAFPHLIGAAKRPRVGLELGVGTFVVVLGALMAGLAPDGVRAIAVGVALSVLVCWYLVVALAVPELGTGVAFGPALRAGADRFARSPTTAVWFLLLSTVCAAVAGATVVTLLLFLPGTLGLLAAHVAADVASADELQTTGGEAET